LFIKPGRRARHPSREGSARTIELGSQHGPLAAPGFPVQESTVTAARQPRSASLQRRTVWRGVGLVAAAHILRSRRFYESLTVGVIVLVALAQMSRKVLVRVVRDLIAWDNARLADLEEQLRHQRMAQAQDGAILEGTVIAARQPGASSRQRSAVWVGVALVAAERVLRNRRFDEQVIVFIFALAALSQMGWKELVRVVRDLIAWDNARLADLEKQLRRQRGAKAGQPG
jgi:hypothetical protein